MRAFYQHRQSPYVQTKSVFVIADRATEAGFEKMDFLFGHLAVEKWGPVGSQLVPLTWTAHSSWTDLGWEHATSNWEGVTVNTSHTVVEIRLCESSLQGVIHENVFFHFSLFNFSSIFCSKYGTRSHNYGAYIINVSVLFFRLGF